MTAAVGDVADPVVEDGGGARGRRGSSTRRLLAAVLVAVNLPIVVATVRALARGWQPIGDNGILLVRARDVGTSHNPLLGTWTSASIVLDSPVNNPGPLYFDAIAPAVRLLGPWVGLAVGVMLVNMAASSLAVVVARRLGGDDAMVAVAIAVVGLQWAMGSELLFDVWQPNALVLPFFAFLVVVSALAAGDLAMAPWAVGLGSLIVQTHMSHAVLVVVLTTAAIALCVLSGRRSDEPTRWRRPLAWTAAVCAVAWVQPLVEQFTGAGRGNLSRIAGAATGQDAPAFGWSTATRIVAEVTAMSPWFRRESYASAVPPSRPDEAVHGIVGTGPAVAVLVGLLAMMLVAVGWAVRSGRRDLAALSGTAGIALATAVVALATSPMSFAGVALHQMRWLWPVAALLTAAGLTVVLALLRSRPVHRPALVGLAGAAALVASANLPTHVSSASGPIDTLDHLASGRELMGQLDAVEGRGTVLYDTKGLVFGEPYSGMTFAELQDRGIPFVFDDEGSVRQFGEGRRHDGSASLRMWQRQGRAALDVPAGAERVALAEGPEGPVALFVEPLEGG